MRHGRRRFGVGRKLGLLALACLVLLAAAVPVMADPSGPEPRAPGAPVLQASEYTLPSTASIAAAHAKWVAEEEEREQELETQPFVAEREESRHAYQDESRSGAEDLLRSTFGGTLESLNNEPARLLSDVKLDKNLGEASALITDDGRGEILESSSPIEVKNEAGETEKVDLSLESGPEGFEPQNPATELTIGKTVEEGVEVGEEGVAVTQVGAEESTGHLLGNKNVFFDEVEEEGDIDMMVSPTAHGAEVFDMLRSVDSPETIRFHVDVPEGDTLRKGPGGGAEVFNSEEEIVGMIPPPHGEDAQGTYVPVELEVEGDSIVLQTHHREEDLAYPILIDPELVFEFWGYWYAGQNLQGIAHWTSGEIGGYSHFWQPEDVQWPGWRGLFIAQPNAWLTPGQGAYAVGAPNTDSYISDLEINPFQRKDQGCPSSEPYDFAGYYDEVQGHWNEEKFNEAKTIGAYKHEGWGHLVEFGLGVDVEFESQCWRDLAAGGVSFHLGDWSEEKGEPFMLSAVSSAPNTWINANSTFNLTVHAKDAGLGIKEITVTPSGPTLAHEEQTGCIGNLDSPCQTNFEHTYTYSAQGFSQGESQVQVSATSPTDLPSPSHSTFSLKVDTEPPELSLNGQLETAVQKAEAVPTEKQGKGGPELSQPVYNLKIQATDGTENTTDPTLKRSGVKAVEVIVTDEAGTKVESSKYIPNTNPSCSAGNSCGQVVTYPVAMTGLAPGKHHLTVKAWDFAGNRPKERGQEFEYFPATGLTEEDVTQRFLLPDGKSHGEGSYEGPELAVNVMNGNVIYHQRDVNVEGPNVNLEAELFYNSQLPKELSSEFGLGWTLKQESSIALEGSGGSAGSAGSGVSGGGAVTSVVHPPSEMEEPEYSPQLNAVVTRQPGGVVEVEEASNPGTSMVYDEGSGNVTEVQETPTAGIKYGYEGSTDKLSDLSVDDQGTTDVPPSPTQNAPIYVPEYVSSFGTAGAGNGQLSHPAGIALDPQGNVWVADSGNNRVEESTAGGAFVKSLGSTGSANGQFNNPKSVAFDAAGDLWVADTGNSRVEEFGPTGTFLRAVGTHGSGTGQFWRPEHLTVAADGHVLVCDDERVIELNAEGGWIKVIAPSGGGSFEPTGIDTGPNGEIWVGEEEHWELVEFSRSGELIRRVGPSVGGGGLGDPQAIAVGALGEVWVGEAGAERVQEFTKEGAYVTSFGVAGAGAGQFQFSAGVPMGISVGREGDLLVTDSGNYRVEHWQVPHQTYKPVFSASYGSTGSGQLQFRHPGGLAVDDQGDVWVPDVENNRIEELRPNGEFKGQIGSAGAGPGQFSRPKSIAFTNDGEFWVADSGNNRLEEFTETGEFIRSVGSLGSGNGQFNGPEAVAIAPNGHIWVADTYNYRIVELDEEGKFIRVVNPSGLGHIEPTGIAFGPGGNAWIADWSGARVVEINPAGELVRQFGTSGTGNGQFEEPDTVAVDPRGIVYVVDEGNSRVQVFNQTGEYLSQFGSAGAGAGQFSFAYPTGIAADRKGDLWVSDNNNRIQKWLTGAQAPEEETIPAHDDPSVEVKRSGSLITALEGSQAGAHHYGHSGQQLLVSDQGPEGTTTYEYELERLKKITLPSGTTASIKYDSFGRATEVTVTPAEGKSKHTKFTYTQELGETETGKTVAENHKLPLESREVEVEPQEEVRTFYAIDAAGDVVKSWNVEVAPEITGQKGSLTEAEAILQPERTLRDDTQELFVQGEAPEGIEKIQFIVNGTTIVDEKTCEGGAVACKNPSLQWIVEPEDLPTGTMWIEVVLTSRVAAVPGGEHKKFSKRWWVTVPYFPPVPLGVPQPPKYKEVLEFREEYGLDLDLNPVVDELELHGRVIESLGAWHDPESEAGKVAYATWERWGVPLRYVDEQELEYREAYFAQDAPLIQAWAKEHAWDVYGGYYMDERAGGLLRVGFTEHQAELITQMKQELGGQLAATDRIVGFTNAPTWTVAQIEGNADSIEENWESGSAIGENVVGVEFDPATNKVRVGAENISAAEAETSSIIGSLARVEFVQAPEPPEFLAGRNRTTGPVKAGDFIRTENNGCTAAFGATEQAPPGQPTKRFLLTAGHCFEIGATVGRAEQYGFGPHIHPIGEVVRNALPVRDGAPRERGETDGLAIALQNPNIAPTEIFPSKPLKAASPDSEFEPEIEKNNKLCFSGAFDGLQCGISAGKVYVVLHEGSFRSGKMNEIRVTGVEVEHGDSGAPVWNTRTGRPVGVLSGGENLEKPNGAIFVAPLRRLPTEFGVHQPGLLEALSHQIGPLWLNLP